MNGNQPFAKVNRTTTYAFWFSALGATKDVPVIWEDVIPKTTILAIAYLPAPRKDRICISAGCFVLPEEHLAYTREEPITSNELMHAINGKSHLHGLTGKAISKANLIAIRIPRRGTCCESARGRRAWRTVMVSQSIDLYDAG